jgi:hypothetical protein
VTKTCRYRRAVWKHREPGRVGRIVWREHPSPAIYRHGAVPFERAGRRRQPVWVIADDAATSRGAVWKSDTSTG